MKKTWFIIGLAGLLAVIGYYFVSIRSYRETAADFLPEDVLLVVEQKNLGSLLTDFTASRMGKAVTGMDFVKIATDLGLGSEVVTEVSDTRKEVETFLGSPLFQEFFGQEFTLALLPIAEVNLNVPEKIMASSFVCIAKPKRNSEFLKMLSSLFAGKLEQTTSAHGKHSLQQYRLSSETTLTVTSSCGLIIAALDDKLVRASLDRNDKKEKNLAQSQEYTRLHQEFTDAQFFSFVSTPALHQQLRHLTEGFDALQKEEIEKTLSPLQGWQGIAFGVWQDKGGIRDKGIALFNKEKIDPVLAKLLAVSPTENASLSMIPADIMGYYWSNSVDMQIFWESFTREMQDSAEQVKALEQGVKTSTGLELQEIFAMFGSEAVVVLKEILTTGLVPLPNGAVFLKLEKEKDFMQLAQSQLAKTGIPTRTEEYKGVSFNILDISLHPSMQPVFAIHKGYLLMATTVDLVKKIIDSQDGKGLVSSAGFVKVNQKLNQGLTAKANNSISYIEIASLVTMVKGVINWGSVILALQEPEVARQAKVISEQVILPLLDGLSAYEVVATRSEIKNDTILLESTTVFTPVP